MPMDIALLHAVVEVAKAGGFREAARVTGSNASRLSDAVRRAEQQLGIRLTIAPGPNEVRTLRGITILVHEQRGLCRKTRQSIPAAIRQALERRPEISYELLDEGGLFGAP